MMNSLAMIVAQSSPTSIPTMLLPWLGVILILVCLWCMIEVIRRIRKVGVTKINLVLMIVCLSVIVFLGYGAQAVRDIFAGQELIRLVLGLSSVEATVEDLNVAVDQATSDDERLLAFDVFSQSRPRQALAWIDDPDNVLRRDHPNVLSRVKQRQPKLLARAAATNPRKVPLVDLDSFQGLANLAQTDRGVATMLRDGRFDVSALDQERLTEILGNLHAIRNGDRIVIQPDSDD